MPCIEIHGLRREIDLVIFDKDGTLVDFDQLWTGKLKRAVDLVMQQTGVKLETAQALHISLGVDVASGKTIPESPLAVATLARLGMVCATVLYQHGLPWHRAETIADQVFMPVIVAAPTSADLAPFGDLTGFFTRLQQAGLKLAICTSDDRMASEATLPLLGIAGLIGHMVCGDDGLASKPAPDGILHLAHVSQTHPSRILMVGDSAGDMLAGRNAGAGMCAAVLCGTGIESALRVHADVVMADIHAIRPIV